MARKPRKTSAERAKDPSTPSLFYKSMCDEWGIVSDVVGGTLTMRAAGERRMPRHEGESRMRYKDRLMTATLTNYTEITLDYWVGKPYAKPVTLAKGSHPDLMALVPDIDNGGNDLTVVSKDWFKGGLEKRVSYCFIDFPKAKPNPDGSPLTLADQIKQNLRPYWVILPAESVIAAYKDMVQGEEVYTHVRYYNNTTKMNGFDEVIQQRIYEYNLDKIVNPETLEVEDVQVRCRIWLYNEDDDEWTAKPETYLSIKRIPLVCFDTGKMELIDLAHLNITHWQSGSDQRACLTVARFPILAGKGVDKNTVITLGPYNFLAATDPNSEYYYVEHSGSALSQGEKDLERLVADMSLYGAEMLKDRPDRETATAAVIDTAQATAPLQVHVFNFKSCLEQAFYYTAMWLDLNPDENDVPAFVDIYTDFAMTEEQNKQVTNLSDAYGKGAISRRQYLKCMVEAKALPPAFDLESNEKELEQEASAKADQAAEDAKKLAAAVPPKPAMSGAQ